MQQDKDKNQDVTLAVLKSDMEYLKREIGTITSTLSILQENYIKRKEIEEIGRNNNKIHEDLNKRLTITEMGLEVFKTQVKTWGSAGILAIGIMQYFISMITK